MNYHGKFSPKAEIYAHYRWHYHPQAITKIVEIAGINRDSVVADIGSGTGMLTAHLVSQVKQIYAIEPNLEMMAIAIKNLAQYPAFTSVNAFADSTTLPNHCLDLIVVGRAIHWFNLETTKAEFQRILKPNGWLAICQVPYEDLDLLEAIKHLKKEEYGWNVTQDQFRLSQKSNLITHYFPQNNYQTLKYFSVIKENWLEFLGRVCSFSPAPNRDHYLFDKFELEAKKIFDKYSDEGILTIKNSTEIKLGQLS